MTYFVKLRRSWNISILPSHTGSIIRLVTQNVMTKKLSWRPRGDHVLVKPNEKVGEKKLASGIIIPESAADKEKFMTGIVIAVGPGKRNDKGDCISIDIATGTIVAFKQPWDEPLKIDGEEYYVLSESEISLIQK